eukprot:TRINITY_DN12947_c0_g1_i1.p1 TRINITY_DN12947_c0_g1~~TRINITY_DN12947_c0_g1_i1.p1  ORF type:complete len:150 (-),score=32.47 TRINITY_DN12947_c0_g1_i1:129-578(-)
MCIRDRRMAAGLKLTKDKRTVSAPGTSCSHKTILTTHGYSSGVHIWEVKLEAQAGCYSAVGVVQNNFSVNGGVMGIAANSWGFSLYPGTHCAASPKRKTYGTGPLGAGTKVRVKLDMDKKTMNVYVNSVERAAFTGIDGHVFPCFNFMP